MDTIKRLDERLAKVENASKDIRKYVSDIVDDSSFVELDVFTAGKAFLDGSEALGEGVITGYATLGGRPVYLFAQNSAVLKGSFSLAMAKKITKAMELAAKSGVPFLSIIDSAGARLGEGVGVLEGYASVLRAAAELEGIVPHIAVVKGAAVGMMAELAALADFTLIDEESGFISLNPPMAVAAKADKVGASNVELFGAKAIHSANLVGSTFKGAKELALKLFAIFDILDAGVEFGDDANRTSDNLNSDKSVAALLAALADGSKYFELGGSNTPCVTTAIAKVNGFTVGILAAVSEEGLLCKCGLRKATVFVNKLNMLDIPLITLVDAKGVKSDLEKEQKGIAFMAARLTKAIALSSVPKLAVITGNAIGYPYATLASKAIGFGYVLAFADAAIAPVSAEVAVNFSYADEIAKAKDPVAARQKLFDTYTEREGNPFISAKDGYVDNVIEAAALRPYVCSILNMLLV